MFWKTSQCGLGEELRIRMRIAIAAATMKQNRTRAGHPEFNPFDQVGERRDQRARRRRP